MSTEPSFTLIKRKIIVTDLMITKKEIISSDNTIYALKAGNEDFLPSRIFESLKSGEGRFGWSYEKTSNISDIKVKLDESNWANLSEDEQGFYEKAAFMLNFKAGDWVVYINMPTYGRCVAAKVIGPYEWRFEDTDFNHRFPVDSSSVFEFDRNDAKVFPKLRARLKLQGRWWTIYAKEEFSKLVEAQAVGFVASPYTAKTNFNFLASEIRPHLAEITKSMHRTHPNKDLEPLIAAAMRNVPGVQNVKCQGGAGDHGADILVEFESGLPIAMPLT